MTFRSLFLAAILSVALAAPALADSASCQAFVKAETDKAMVVFHDKSASEMDKRKQLAAIFREAVDTDWIGRAVLAQHWKELAPEQQKTYLQLYGTYLSSSYISKFDAEDGMAVDGIKMLGFTAVSGGYEAKTLIENKADSDVHVDYLVDDSAGHCRVHDIRVEGVSLMISQRSEFGNAAAQGGAANIITLLQNQLKQIPAL